MIKFTALHPNVPVDVAVGYIPEFLVVDDPRPAKEQINERYIAGWFPFVGHKLNKMTMALKYPEDPVLMPLAYAHFRDERIFVYPHGWTLIMQLDGSWEVARLD